MTHPQAGRVGFPAGNRAGDFAPVHRASLPRDDVDHAEERVVAVKRGAGTADDLHPLDHVHINQPLRAAEGRIVDRFVGAMTVHRDQDSSTVIPGPAHPAHPDVGVNAVGSDIEAADVAQDIVQRPVAALFDLVGSNNGNGGWSLRDFLLMLGSAINHRHLHLHQVLQLHAGEVVSSSPAGHGSAGTGWSSVRRSAVRRIGDARKRRQAGEDQNSPQKKSRPRTGQRGREVERLRGARHTRTTLHHAAGRWPLFLSACCFHLTCNGWFRPNAGGRRSARPTRIGGWRICMSHIFEAGERLMETGGLQQARKGLGNSHPRAGMTASARE